MGWFVVFWVYLTFTLITHAMKKKPPGLSPSSLSEMNIPTVGEGRPIPIVFGTCKLDSPMITWYGDLKTYPVRRKTWSFLIWHGKVTIGFQYWLGMQFALCSGEINGIAQVRFDDEVTFDVIRTEINGITDLHFEARDCFGGPEDEGGVAGLVRIYSGSAVQEPDDYMEAVIGGDGVPAYRGIAYAVFRHVYLGTSPYLKRVSFVVKRCPNDLGLMGGAEEIDGDANPASMIYDILTGRVYGGDPVKSGNPFVQYGLGFPVGMIDTASFLEAGQTLADEGLGLSMIFESSRPAEDAIMDILNHIDAAMYVEPGTGLLVLKLIRKDYVIGELPQVNESSCELESFARPTIATIKNSVRVNYLDRGVIVWQGYGER